MPDLLRHLVVEELIVHEVPRRLSKRILRESPDAVEDEPILSEIASPINERIKGFFYTRISDTIGSSDALSIIFDFSSESPVKELVAEYFNSNNDKRIRITQDIAKHLYAIQNAQNSGGLLLFVCCSCQGQKVLAILKVEREEGVRLIEQIERDGLRTFNVEHIPNLMLTEKTKLFKIVLFYLDNEDELIKGFLCDKQRGYYGKGVADFFLSDFLGCKLTEEPQILTKRFYEKVLEFINERIESPEQKNQLLTHLISELTSQNQTINVNDFARRTLPPDKRDEFKEFIELDDINNFTIGSFPKDCCLIEKKLRKIQYDFSSGISVFGSPDAIKEYTTISVTPNGQTRMEITDTINKVRTK